MMLKGRMLHTHQMLIIYNAYHYDHLLQLFFILGLEHLWKGLPVQLVLLLDFQPRLLST